MRGPEEQSEYFWAPFQRFVTQLDENYFKPLDAYVTSVGKSTASSVGESVAPYLPEFVAKNEIAGVWVNNGIDDDGVGGVSAGVINGVLESRKPPHTSNPHTSKTPKKWPKKPLKQSPKTHLKTHFKSSPKSIS